MLCCDRLWWQRCCVDLVSTRNGVTPLFSACRWSVLVPSGSTDRGIIIILNSVLWRNHPLATWLSDHLIQLPSFHTNLVCPTCLPKLACPPKEVRLSGKMKEDSFKQLAELRCVQDCWFRGQVLTIFPGLSGCDANIP